MEIDQNKAFMPAFHNPYYFGHDHIRQFIGQQIKGNLETGQLEVAALLFEGNYGIGKSTFAFHLAWNILSGQLKNEGTLKRPDKSCPLWHRIVHKSEANLLHITRPFDIKTGKFRTSITIDEIRKIATFLQRTSAGNGWRIVIIDPADDMNHNGANGLLKMLEEPPARTLFILISHHPGKLLRTIRSRCYFIRFYPLSDDTIEQILSYLPVFSQFQTLSLEDRQKILSFSEGSIGRALLILHSSSMTIAQSLEQILSSDVFPIDEVYLLASLLNNRDDLVQFDFFVDYLLDFLAKMAKKAGVEGQLTRSQALSEFWTELQNELNEARIYNLDKKQLIITILQKVYHFLYQNG